MCHWYIDISAKNQFVRKSVFARLRIDGSCNSPQIVFSHSAPDRNKLFRDKTNLEITLAKYHLETFLQMRRRKVFQNFPHCCSKLSERNFWRSSSKPCVLPPPLKKFSAQFLPTPLALFCKTNCSNWKRNSQRFLRDLVFLIGIGLQRDFQRDCLFLWRGCDGWW